MPTFDELSLKLAESDAPVCRHLRTKALHIYGQDTPDAYLTSRSTHYHCLRTSFVTGPDDELCVPEHCTAERTCFELR